MKYIFLFLTFFIITLSCKKQVDYLLPTAEQKIVVNCIINPDSIVNCTVFFANGIERIDSTTPNYNILNKNLHYDSTAIVKVYKANLLFDSMQYVGNGMYQGHIQPEAGYSYQLVVLADGNTLSATTTIPIPTPLDSVVLINKWMANVEPLRPELNTLGKLITYFKDDANSTNYYDQFIISGVDSINDLNSIAYAGGGLLSQYPFEFKYNKGMSDFIENEGDVAYNPGSALYNDKTFNGKSTYTYIIGPSNCIFYINNNKFYNYMGRYTLLCTTSVEYYTYRKAYIRNVATSVAGLDQGTNSIHNLLFPPIPYPAYSNIVGKGGVGIFAGYSSSIKQARMVY